MKTTLKRVLSGLAAAAIGATMVPLLTAPVASAAGVPQPGGATVSPSSGTSATNFNVALPTGAACTGDSANGGYRVQSYMVPASVDPSTLTFGMSGPLPSGMGASFRQPLYDVNGSGYVNAMTANATTTGGPGPIINIPTFNYQVFVPGNIPPGAYNLGIACTLGPAGPTQMKEFWNTTLTFATNSGDSFANVSWTVGAVPAAPVIGAVAPGDGTLAVSFTHAASNPATTGYTVTATPAGGGTAVTATGAASPITVTGLVNGTPYDVTVRATNSVGDSAESAPASGTPAPVRPAVQNLQLTQGAPGSGAATITWTAPTGDVPSGYEVVAAPAGPTVVVTGTSAEVTGMAPDKSYTFTVTPKHADGFDGQPASVTATALPAAVVFQELQVTVPEGALTITQVCGQGPTGCEVSFGTASLITSGPGRGQFYEASAALRQVTVTDTRDTDDGWTATGTMEDFSAGVGKVFSGDQLGWTPAAVGSGNITSPTGGTYVQTVTPGAPVAPNTPGGLGTGATLASAPAGAGLGIFELDAALELLIPVGQIDGDYSGTLTITAS